MLGMFCTQHLSDMIAERLILAESGLFGADGDPIKFGLATNEFTPGLELTYEDLVQPVFTGYAEIQQAAGAAALIKDHDSGSWGYLVKEPAGGFKWVCTAAPEAPITITGFYAVSEGSLYAAVRFDVNKTISQVGDFVEVSAILGFQRPAILDPVEQA